MSALFLKNSEISAEHLAIALTQVKLGFWELDLKTGRLTCTPQNKLNFGFDAERDVTPDDIVAAILPEDRMRREEAFQKALQPDCGIYSFDCRVRHADQHLHWLQVRGSVLFEEGVAVRIIGTTLDITEKKDLELLRDEMLSITNHELKTPLSAVKGYLQLLHRFVMRTGNEQYEKIAHRALNATEKVTRLLSDALHTERGRENQMTLRKESIDMIHLVEEVAANTMLLNQDYQISVNYGNNVQPVMADRYRIGQVLTNMMNNAVKYSPEHQQIDVDLQAEAMQIQISIRDYGIGIPLSEQPKIFQKFYRVPEVSKTVSGSGIGLFLSSEIIARHGGEIGFMPVSQNTGTCIYFTLPY